MIEEADEWPSIKEVRGQYSKTCFRNFLFYTLFCLEVSKIEYFLLGDWSKVGAVFSAEDLALLDSAGRPQQVSNYIN